MAITKAQAAAAERVDGDRLWRRHMDMAVFGATAAGGVNRQALSAEEAAARAALIGWGRARGLKPFADAVGNLFLRLEGLDPTLPPVMTGSHLDSQPTGGKFDGVYGVLAGFEAVEALLDAGLKPARSIEVVAWMNEEGSRFAPGMMGSEVYAGDRDLDEVLAAKDADGVTVAQSMAAMNAALPALDALPLGRPIAAYVEAHIEQGPVLERAGKTIGAVTGLQGKQTFRVTVTGEEAHAGTVPLAARKDALIAATAMVQRLHALCAGVDERVMFTVGRFVVTPSAPSVVAGRVVFSIDLRHPENSVLRSLGDQIEPICAGLVGPCRVAVERLVDVPSIDFDARLRGQIRTAAETLNFPVMEILSAAGHDARQMNPLAPTGMIFVPSRDGVSHNEAEWTEPADLTAGVRVLAAVLADISGAT